MMDKDTLAKSRYVVISLGLGTSIASLGVKVADGNPVKIAIAIGIGAIVTTVLLYYALKSY